MSSVSFPSLPNGWRLPLFWAEIDPSHAGGAPNANLPALLVGQITSAGSVSSGSPSAVGVPVAVGSPSMADSFFGAGSMLAAMCRRFFAINPAAEVFCLPIADPSPGLYATATFTESTTKDFLVGDVIVVGNQTFTLVSSIGSTPGNILLQANTNAGFALTMAAIIASMAASIVSGPATATYVPNTTPANISGSLAAGNGLTTGQTCVFTALAAGTAGNSLVSTYTPSGTSAGSFGGSTFSGGAAGSGVVATGKITVSTAATAAGVLTIYIGDQAVQVAVATTDTTANVAANFVSACAAALPALPVTVTQGSSGHLNDIILTCNWAGVTGNDILIQPNYLGAPNDEFMPTGMTLAITPMASGAGIPSWSTPISNLGDDVYYYVGMPYTDTGSLAAWDVEYGFTSSGRWGWMRQLYGNIYSAIRGTYSTLISWGPTGNSGVESIMGVEPSSPSPVWAWTAAYAAQAMQGFSEDPARPLQTLELTGIIPALKQDRWTKAEANALAGVGVAVQMRGPNGYPMIMIEATRYQVNSYGSPDIAYNLVTTLTTLAALLTAMKSAITSKYPRSKLADDGTNFATGQAIVTPKSIRGEIISEYIIAVYNGLVEDVDTFGKNLVVERSSTNPNRVDVLYPPNLIGQLRIFAVLAQFRLLGASAQPIAV